MPTPQIVKKDTQTIYTQKNHNPEFLYSFGMHENQELIKKINQKYQRFPRDFFVGNVAKVKRFMS